MSNHFGTTLSLLVTFQLLFVAVFLFSYKRGNKRNNWILGLIFLLLAISMADLTILVSGIEIKIKIKALHLFDDAFLFLYGPLFYLYANGVLFKDFKLKKIHLLHFIPFVVLQSMLLVEILSLNLADQAEVTRQIVTAELPSWMYIVVSTFYVYLFIYLWFSYRTVLNYRAIIKDKFSSIHRINFDWLTFIIRSFTIITIIAMANNVIPVFGNAYIHYGSLIALLIFIFFFVNKVLMKALNQPEIFSSITIKEKEKYLGSNLETEVIDHYKDKLILMLDEKQLYLNPELSLKDLADNLLTTPKVLSQVINQSFNQKFYDLINSYRCEEVKRILGGPDEMVTISEAMYQSGFNSKSSFNKEFKKLTGQTPSGFKNSIGK